MSNPAVVEIPLEEVSTIISDAKEEYEKLRQYAEEAIKEISNGQLNSENLGQVLKAWKFSFEKK